MNLSLFFILKPNIGSSSCLQRFVFWSSELAVPDSVVATNMVMAELMSVGIFIVKALDVCGVVWVDVLPVAAIVAFGDEFEILFPESL